MSPERLFIVARDFPGGGALRLLRATKSHSDVAPVHCFGRNHTDAFRSQVSKQDEQAGDQGKRDDEAQLLGELR